MTAAQTLTAKGADPSSGQRRLTSPTRLSHHAYGRANVKRIYSIFGGVAPRLAEFRKKIACEINSLEKVGV